jgi:hypothetical protein
VNLLGEISLLVWRQGDLGCHAASLFLVRFTCPSALISVHWGSDSAAVRCARVGMG